jgi:hypothetical protein
MPRRGGHRRRMRIMTPAQAERAIWIDFEGTTTEDPSMLGVLWMPERATRPELTQYVFDEGLALATGASPRARGHRIVMADMETTLRNLVDLAEESKRHLVAWSLYDYDVIQGQLGRVAVRYRNAKQTAKDWRNRRTQLAPHLPEVEFPRQELQRYLQFVGYEVDEEFRSDAATQIRTVRERSATQDSWETVSKGGKEAWSRLVEHNKHDLFGMRHVARLAVGLEELGVGSKDPTP